ncbi:MAG: sulfotransferase domain-containing protein [Phycisphaeraceae bacterium]
MTEDRNPYLIIAGVTRAGTTSLFNYLSAHPNVQPSTIKETRFFMDTDELRRLHRYEEGLEAYARYFPNAPAGAVRLEATPDYVYRAEAARRIGASLPNTQVVIVLREPISRLISWRKYAIQNGLLDADTTLHEYIQMQWEAEASGRSMPQHLRALREGRYSRYLRPWIDQFGEERLLIINYRDLVDRPGEVVRQVCDRAGLDAGFYADYRFEVHNASRRVRWPGVQNRYRALIWRLKPYVHNRPVVRGVLRKVRRVSDRIVGRSSSGTTTASNNDTLTVEDRRQLEAYYAHEPTELARLLNRDSWTW